VSFRVVVLVSGTGTLLQALIDAYAANPGEIELVGVGSDVADVLGLQRAERAGIPTFVHPLVPFAKRGTPARLAWDAELADIVAGYRPDLIVLAGFMKLFDTAFLARFEGRIINSHPALSPSFPGTHAPRDALAYGVKITGATIFRVDAGVDTGRILAQAPVDVLDDDTVESLHERIKVVERSLLVSTVASLAHAAASPPTP
jgi:phosphoribosylglycinamide formyltransferase 1